MLVRFRPKAHLVVGARCLRMCDHELVAKRAKQVRAACDAAASELERINQRIATLTTEAAAHGLTGGDAPTSEGKAAATGFVTHDSVSRGAGAPQGSPAVPRGLRAGSSARNLVAPPKMLPDDLKRDVCAVVTKCSASYSWDTRRLVAIGYAKHLHRRLRRRYDVQAPEPIGDAGDHAG